MSFPNTSCKEKTAHKKMVSIRESRRGQTDVFIITEAKVRDQPQCWCSSPHIAFWTRVLTEQVVAWGREVPRGCLFEHNSGLRREDIYQVPVWVEISLWPLPARHHLSSGKVVLCGAWRSQVAPPVSPHMWGDLPAARGAKPSARDQGKRVISLQTLPGWWDSAG